MNQEARVSCLPCQATTTVTTTVSSSAVIVIAPPAPRVPQEPVVENGIIKVQPRATPKTSTTPGAESQDPPTAEKVQVLRDLKAIGMLSQNQMIEAIYGATENAPNDLVEHPQIVQDQQTKEEPPVVGIHGETSATRGGWALIRVKFLFFNVVLWKKIPMGSRRVVLSNSVKLEKRT
ncbi:hypothetical protein CAEBREN_19548 [Caenorhabditis brenneri]|uniref:Uncharacterized protein n=1 Tax=Caenorhabditis brenneri TaxID=135651 RepID=G0N2Z4_CAEBE|nr:hypothetical protein CAEBREN_19548 [Caenorhabditis brenneri]